MISYCWFILISPLIGFLVLSWFGNGMSRQRAGLIGCGSVGISFLITLTALVGFLLSEESKKGGVIKISDEFKKVKKNKAFWVKLVRPLNQNEISSIQSEIYELS